MPDNFSVSISSAHNRTSILLTKWLLNNSSKIGVPRYSLTSVSNTLELRLPRERGAGRFIATLPNFVIQDSRTGSVSICRSSTIWWLSGYRLAQRLSSSLGRAILVSEGSSRYGARLHEDRHVAHVYWPWYPLGRYSRISSLGCFVPDPQVYTLYHIDQQHSHGRR